MVPPKSIVYRRNLRKQTDSSVRLVPLDIKWRRSDGIERGEYIGNNKFKKLTDIISITSDISEKTFDVSGILVGINVRRRAGYFQLVIPEGETYTGTLSGSFDRTKHWEVNTRYTASITEKTVTQFATEQVTRSRILEGLEIELYA